jgi:DNA-binding transcriptional MerR regulator
MTTDKAPDAFRTISEAAEDLGLEQHVLRFWETRFPQIKPLKRGGGRRYYRPDDVDFLRGLKHLLHAERYTIKGVQKIIKEQGVKSVQNAWKGVAVQAASPPPVSAPPPAPVAVRPAPAAPVSGSVRTRLEAALAELMDCRRALAALRQA